MSSVEVSSTASLANMVRIDESLKERAAGTTRVGCSEERRGWEDTFEGEEEAEQVVVEEHAEANTEGEEESVKDSVEEEEEQIRGEGSGDRVGDNEDDREETRENRERMIERREEDMGERGGGGGGATPSISEICTSRFFFLVLSVLRLVAKTSAETTHESESTT